MAIVCSSSDVLYVFSLGVYLEWILHLSSVRILKYAFKNNTPLALAGVAQWIKDQTVNQRVSGSIPSQTHARVVGQVPGRGHARGNHTLMFLSVFLLPFPSF